MLPGTENAVQTQANQKAGPFHNSDRYTAEMILIPIAHSIQGMCFGEFPEELTETLSRNRTPSRDAEGGGSTPRRKASLHHSFRVETHCRLPCTLNIRFTRVKAILKGVRSMSIGRYGPGELRLRRWREGVGCYRGIDITRSPWAFLCGRADGLPPNGIEVLWNSGVGRVKIRESVAPAEPPNAGPRSDR